MKQLLEIARRPRQRNSSRASRAAAPEISSPTRRWCCAPPVPMPPRRSRITTVLAEHLSLPLLESVRLHQQSQPKPARRTCFCARSAYEKNRLRRPPTPDLWIEQRFSEHLSGVADGDVVLSDGSGLARDDLVTPRATGRSCSSASTSSSPGGSDYISTFPVAGVGRNARQAACWARPRPAAFLRRRARLDHVRGVVRFRDHHCAASIWFSPCSAITTRSVARDCGGGDRRDRRGDD